MGKIVVTEFISLDGVIEDPGGSENYSRGGWAFDFDRGQEGTSSSSTSLTKPRPSCWAASPTKASPPPGPSAKTRPASPRR